MARNTAAAAAKERKPSTRILIKHPDLKAKDPAQTTVGAFDAVWSKKGWVEVTDTEAVEAVPAESGKED